MTADEARQLRVSAVDSSLSGLMEEIKRVAADPTEGQYTYWYGPLGSEQKVRIRELGYTLELYSEDEREDRVCYQISWWSRD